MIDPLTRWAAYGEKPDYAGLLTYAGLPYTEDPAELEGVDAAIVGAPMDELTSDSPGTRFGPRAIRAASCAPGPHLEAGVDALRARAAGRRLRRRADPPRRPGALARRRSRTTVAQVLAAGAIPIILGGDHSIAEPDIRAVRRGPRPGRPDPLRHPHRHRPRGLRRDALARLLHVPARRVRPRRPERYVQIGLRGYWPGEEEFAWQRERGIVSHFMHDVRDRGIRAVVADAIAHVGAGPVFLSRRHRRARPGLRARHRHARAGRDDVRPTCCWPAARSRARVDLVGAEVVEVLPDRIGSRDITALVAERVVRETLTGVALRRRSADQVVDERELVHHRRGERRTGTGRRWPMLRLIAFSA